MQRPSDAPVVMIGVSSLSECPDKGHHFLFHITVVLLVAYGFVSGVHPVIQPCFRVDAVDAEYFDLACVD
jgi:hypothetical protein